MSSSYDRVVEETRSKKATGIEIKSCGERMSMKGERRKVFHLEASIKCPCCDKLIWIGIDEEVGGNSNTNNED